MTDYKLSSWSDLRANVGLQQVNKELDERTNRISKTLRDITSVSCSNAELCNKIRDFKNDWYPATDQYERTVLHLAALNGNTRLAVGLVYCGARINARDGIGQTALTLALHKEHFNTAKKLIENGATLENELYGNTIPPLEIARVKENEFLISLIEEKIKKEKEIKNYFASYFKSSGSSECVDDAGASEERKIPNYARLLDINVGDQKNTVTVQGCANRCPDMYGCHTPGGGDFHARGYVNESIARIAGPGGFWHVTERVMKRPTVNPKSFKSKFKENNYNNNEEALIDYDAGVSLAMIKSYQESSFFPTSEQLSECKATTGNHNDILLKKFEEWTEDLKNDKQASYHLEIINDLVPITKWYKESIRQGNGISLEGVWMLCPALFCQVGKINYRDEAFTQIVNSIAKWPLAYRKLYQQNRTVNLSGNVGRQLAGDEWVEGYLVRPVKQFARAQSSFNMIELMSCSINLLEMNREMYRSREAFNIHATQKHKTPSSVLDQMKVAQFALKEEWFENDDRTIVKRYPWADKDCAPGDEVPPKYINAYSKGDKKAKLEFTSFLHRKFPNDML